MPESRTTENRLVYATPRLMIALAAAFSMTTPVFLGSDLPTRDHRRPHRRRKFKGWQREARRRGK